MLYSERDFMLYSKGEWDCWNESDTLKRVIQIKNEAVNVGKYEKAAFARGTEKTIKCLLITQIYSNV
jgi:hypothetical protein